MIYADLTYMGLRINSSGHANHCISKASEHPNLKALFFSFGDHVVRRTPDLQVALTRRKGRDGRRVRRQPAVDWQSVRVLANQVPLSVQRHRVVYITDELALLQVWCMY